MSATNRGAKLGGALDVYGTPAWCVHRLLEAWRPRPGLVLEPCAGDGAIIRAANQVVPLTWTAVEIREDKGVEPINWIQGLNGFWTADFLRDPMPKSWDMDRFSAVVTNPPYRLAEQFIRRSRELCPRADICFLLRLNFLASAERIPLYRDLGVPDVFVLPDRPCFRGGKSDACEYGWFVWDPEPRTEGAVVMLRPTPAAERGKKPRVRRAA